MNRRPDPVQQALAGEQRADLALARLHAGIAHPDELLNVVLAALVLDGQPDPVAGPALRC